MTSVVYPVGGGFEDWAYGAGWDKAKNAAVLRCHSDTYPLLDSFYEDDSTDHISTAIYLIEMDRNKNPPESSYGSRLLINKPDSS